MQLAVQLQMKAADSFVPRLPSFASTLHNRWGSTRSPQDSRRPPRDADPDGRNHTMPLPRSPQSPQLRHNHSRGSSIVEFALILPLVLLLTVAVIDFGRAFFVRNIVEQAAREGARLRAVTSVTDSARVTARINQVIASAGVMESLMKMSNFALRLQPSLMEEAKHGPTVLIRRASAQRLFRPQIPRPLAGRV